MANGFVTVQSSRERLGVVSYPLHEATKQGNADMVRMLLEAGANPMKKDSMGRTAEELAEARNWFGRKGEVLAALRDAMYSATMFGLDEEVADHSASAFAAAGSRPAAPFEPPVLPFRGDGEVAAKLSAKTTTTTGSEAQLSATTTAGPEVQSSPRTSSSEASFEFPALAARMLQGPVQL